MTRSWHSVVVTYAARFFGNGVGVLVHDQGRRIGLSKRTYDLLKWGVYGPRQSEQVRELSELKKLQHDYAG